MNDTGAACPAGGERPLTDGEAALVRSVFGNAVNTGRVKIHRRKWFAFQPRRVTMAPRGSIHFHPDSPAYCDDFAVAPLHRQALFIHEMTHVWQTQTRGEWYLILNRHPWCSYDYTLRPGWVLQRYGIEQQAMIVQHAFMLRAGAKVAGAPALECYRTLLPFAPFATS